MGRFSSSHESAPILLDFLKIIIWINADRKEIKDKDLLKGK